MHDKFNSLFSSYAERLDAMHLSAATKRTYVSLVKQFLYFADESDAACRTAGDITCLDLVPVARQFLATCSDGKASSANSRVVAVKHFFKTCGNIEQRFERPATRLTTLEPLSDEQLEQFKEAARHFCARDRAIALIICDTGIRLKEAAQLNFDSLVVHQECFAVTVNRSGRRQQLDLSDETLAVLGEYLLGNDAFLREDFPQPDKPLFVDKGGDRLSMRGITAVVKKIGWRARLSVTPAILRATRLSRLAMQTQDVLTIAHLAGFECEESAKRVLKACQRDITTFSVEADLYTFSLGAQRVPTPSAF